MLLVVGDEAGGIGEGPELSHGDLGRGQVKGGVDAYKMDGLGIFVGVGAHQEFARRNTHKPERDASDGDSHRGLLSCRRYALRGVLGTPGQGASEERGQASDDEGAIHDRPFHQLQQTGGDVTCKQSRLERAVLGVVVR